MKLVVLSLAVFAAFAFAGNIDLGPRHASEGPIPTGTDAVVFNQTYSFANLLNGLRYTGGYMADDFILDADVEIQGARFWIVYAGSTAPTAYDLAFTQDTGDSDPSTATAVWNESVPCTLFDTGDTNWGYIVWEVSCNFTTFPSLVSGQRYWFELTFQTFSDYWLVSAPVFGSYPYTSADAVTWQRVDSWTDPCDAFFDLYDTPVALQRETWGSIKSIF